MRATKNYYEEERQLYSDAYNIQVSDKKGLIIVHKLCKHYKIFVPKIKYWGYRDGGTAYSGLIRLSHNPSIGLIMHEFSHFAKSAILQKEGIAGMKNLGTSHHGTKFQGALNFVNQYAKTKDYWKNEKEIQVKIKPEEEKTCQEIVDEGVGKVKKLIEEKAEEIAEIEVKINAYLKRMQYFQRLYTTKIKKAKRSLVAHRRVLSKIERIMNREIEKTITNIEK
jgi:hypothetical protein